MNTTCVSTGTGRSKNLFPVFSGSGPDSLTHVPEEAAHPGAFPDPVAQTSGVAATS
jgi:hypothetical protein